MRWVFIGLLISFGSCQGQELEDKKQLEEPAHEEMAAPRIPGYTLDAKTIHVFVALCDNKYQGIVPVNKNLGNGQNPNTNLYWGSAFGVRTFFKRSKNWKLMETRKGKDHIIERLIFKHKTSNYYLVADAYDGKFIKQTTVDFLNSSCGKVKDTLIVKGTKIGTHGNAKLCSYIGHDGLMDFKLDKKFENNDKKKRELIILACYSKHFFAPLLKEANVNPLVWTMGLMAPEAYTLHDALQAYIQQQNNEDIRNKAAAAYAKYQKCGLGAAKRLLVTGW